MLKCSFPENQIIAGFPAGVILIENQAGCWTRKMITIVKSNREQIPVC
jgi:hypothetical protein